jgi:hypothetical protein
LDDQFFGRVEHHRDGDVTLVFHNSLKAPSQALSVVGQTVIGWGLRRPDTVVISFGDGSSLWLVAQVSGYEDFWASAPQGASWYW